MKRNVAQIAAMKGKEKIVMLTAYDALFARLFADAADILLVGDSLAMSFAGAADTLGASLDQMIYHTKAVCNGAPESLVVLDMPFGSFATPEIALAAALRVYQETAAAAVKIEGGAEKAEVVRTLTTNGIAVAGHIGLLPQFFRAAGGFKVRGKDEISAERIAEDAAAIEQAGAFCVVLEGVKASAAARVRDAVKIPVIGIGAGADCDGQVLVWSDMLGFFEAFKPKFARRYVDGAALAREAAAKFAQDVKNGTFPNADESY
ncbi:MAG: 3-methyl-2-oxobutanoate hydroxymethyltransferase [Helicobacteraceae bacterium]|jgi:3-methyl-2-oxobutanoate hydroxymethyltransferase|nr:3-methyl-2-oxobutanoate hydroxymethyltransferase [Helicobacteraceae bacterium]